MQRNKQQQEQIQGSFASLRMTTLYVRMATLYVRMIRRWRSWNYCGVPGWDGDAFADDAVCQDDDAVCQMTKL